MQRIIDITITTEVTEKSTAPLELKLYFLKNVVIYREISKAVTVISGTTDGNVLISIKHGIRNTRISIVTGIILLNLTREIVLIALSTAPVNTNRTFASLAIFSEKRTEFGTAIASE